MKRHKTRLQVERLEERDCPAPLAALPPGAVIIGNLGHGNAQVVWADLRRTNQGALLTPGTINLLPAVATDGIVTSLGG